MSASDRFRVPLAAGQNVPNILAGTIYEFTGSRPRRVSIWAVADPPTVAGNEPLTSCTSGTNVQVSPNTPVQQFTAAQGPNRSDHLLVSFVSAPGDRIVVPLRNPDAANTTVARFLVEYSE